MQHNDILAHFADVYPLAEKKLKFLADLTTAEMLAINDIPFWQKVFTKFLLDLGIDAIINQPIIQTPEDCATVKELISAYYEFAQKTWGWKSRESPAFRRFERLFTQLQARLKNANPQLADAIEIFIRENYYADRSPSKAGRNHQLKFGKRLIKWTLADIDSLDPDADSFFADYKSMTQYETDPRESNEELTIAAHVKADLKKMLENYNLDDTSKSCLFYNLFDSFRVDKRSAMQVLALINEVNIIQRRINAINFIELLHSDDSSDTENLHIDFPLKVYNILEKFFKVLNNYRAPRNNFSVLLINALTVIVASREWGQKLVDVSDNRTLVENIFFGIVTSMFSEWRWTNEFAEFRKDGNYQSTQECAQLITWLNNPKIISALVSQIKDDAFVSAIQVHRYVFCYFHLLRKFIADSDTSDQSQFEAIAIIAKMALFSGKDTDSSELRAEIMKDICSFSVTAVLRAKQWANVANVLNQVILTDKVHWGSSAYKPVSLLMALLRMTDSDYNLLSPFLLTNFNKSAAPLDKTAVVEIYLQARALQEEHHYRNRAQIPFSEMEFLSIDWEKTGLNKKNIIKSAAFSFDKESSSEESSSSSSSMTLFQTARIANEKAAPKRKAEGQHVEGEQSQAAKKAKK